MTVSCEAVEKKQLPIGNDARCVRANQEVSMKLNRGSTLFLKVVILLIALGALIWMIRFPQLEGRATNLDLISIYRDPFIIYGYIASIPFFVALYQAFRLLGYVEQERVFSQTAVKALRNIKFCAVAIIGFIAGGEAFIVLNANGDDYAGPVALGVFTTFVFIVIATAAAVFQGILQNAVDIKSENDLTV